MFKQLRLYQIGDAWPTTAAQLEEALAQEPFTPCTATQQRSTGAAIWHIRHALRFWRSCHQPQPAGRKRNSLTLALPVHCKRPRFDRLAGFIPLQLVIGSLFAHPNLAGKPVSRNGSRAC